MALLSVANLTYSFGDRVLLSGANLTLDAGEHVGMVGRNGTGKSTLMKLIVGAAGGAGGGGGGVKIAGPDAGRIQVAREASAGYLTQDFHLDPNRTLREEAAQAFGELSKLHDKLEEVAHAMADADPDELEKLLKKYEQLEKRMEAAGGYVVDHQIDEALHGVGLTDDTFQVKVGDLSGGQKGRLALAKLLLTAPDILLLDEPTNHLDIAGRQWLEEYLATYKGAVLVVSHDRWLLDRVATKIYELEQGELIEYPGNYQGYREQREQRRLAQHRAYDKQQTKLRHEQAFIDRYRAGQRAKQAQGREKRLDRFKRDKAMDRPVELDQVSIRFGPATRSGDIVVAAENLDMEYESKALFHELSLTIMRGDRVGVIGPNGAGKSTLIRCLLNEQETTAGSARLGARVNVGHYHQTHEHLNLSHTVVEYLRHFVPHDTEQEARDLAGAFLFSGDEQDKALGVLSGGERSRAVLAGLVAGGHNVLVLDEPTNHLDIPSAERLEGALRQFTATTRGYGGNKSEAGTLLVISHDRMLLDHLVDQLIVFDGRGHVEHFLGSYSEYLAAMRERAAGGGDGKQTKNAEKSKSAKRLASSRRQNSQSTVKQGRGQAKGGTAHSKLSQEQLEARIVEMEQKLTKVDADLANPANYQNADKVRQLQQQRARIQDKLTPLEEEWAARAE